MKKLKEEYEMQLIEQHMTADIQALHRSTRRTTVVSQRIEENGEQLIKTAVLECT
jgi:hypothetical protein